ncbi:hypothetical protein [Desulfurivibrio alkaliphilus]|uniref:Uncharacterized protein n=1 Tax=Desulfurivibrio alkaliphilus (strain DSM 19089 / UNIQEM U267 / AHT2) TaxID=589865 RepID=D6Z5V2_DESAT|nr:hypothetical protein [Desulfurivibrio alkaliphilus]ADH84834.1 conserved hypothetical protein [Desulfurivibrio alkaliphilus AHT 2]
MLNEEYLRELEQYIASGRMEQEFACAPEQQRLTMLDQLEKLMDVAELADQAVTRIIFKK